MSIASTFPIFEADQVLTNNHLNSLFNYLDQQSRITRSKLIGSGIVCGLEIKNSANSINVSKGCGLTSQGYMITLCDKEFSHYIPFTAPDYPNDLQLISQCTETDEVSGNGFLFYGIYGQSVLQLITQTEFDNLNADEKATAKALSQVAKNVLDNFAVVLFLDAEEINLKNCDTNDCNDKGSRMDFEVRALLVDKSFLAKILSLKNDSTLLHHVELKRYNVPVQDIKSADDVLNGFYKLVDNSDTALSRLSNDLMYCWTHYNYLLKDESTNPFTNILVELKATRDLIVKKYPILIQYFYDFIDDLIKSFYEFKHKVFDVLGECCGDELKFPFHLMLGEATVDTTNDERSDYRQYFNYSPLFDSQDDKLNEIRSLFTRMKLMIREFILNNLHEAEKNEFIKFDNALVKVTPSQYGRSFISDRSIPYYYKVNEQGNELYRFWNYDKTRRGSFRFNLGYNANLYNAADNIVHPLNYDIEWFNFFRIEGHIGKPVQNALTSVMEIQQNFNLPFDVIALSADYIGAILKSEDPKCVIQDLDSDYRVLIAEFVCKVHDAYCFGAKLPFQLPDTLLRFTAANFTKASAADASQLKSTLSFNPGLVEKINHPFVSSLVNEFQAVTKYTKGDTLQRLCNPAEGTVGNAYIQGIKNNNGNFSNPVTINADQPATTVMYHVFEFIDTVESILELVMTNQLADIDVIELKSRNDRFEKEIKVLNVFAIALLQKLESNDNSNLTDLVSDLYLDLLIFNLEILLHLCFVEQVEALKNEYQRRVAQYRLARNFNYYFKQHGGIEHKAGVPKGGTFILVYHEERKNRFIDVRSLFVNKELSTLLISRFRTLLNPDIEVSEMEFNTNLMEVATLYRDPEIYLRFKDVMTKYLDDCNDLTPAKRKKIKDLIDARPTKQNFVLKDGMVIADFYVPYICCSDCPPVAFILPPLQQVETEDPNIKIDKNKFCSSDKNEYPIIVTPIGGTISGEGVSVKADGTFVFVPAVVTHPGLIVITYTSKGKSASVTVEVVAVPIAKFSFATDAGDGLMVVTLKNDSVNINDKTTYEWSVDGNVFSEKRDPDTISFKVQTLPKTILLKESNGQCPDEFSAEIKLEIENRSISVCRDTKEFALEPNLSGTDIIKVIGNDGIKMNDKSLTIFPSSTPVNQTTTFNISYMINGKQVNVAITEIVLNADFNIKIESIIEKRITLINLTVESVDKNYTTNEWKIFPPVVGFNFTDDPLQNVQWSVIQIREMGKISINHNLTVNTDAGTCTASASFVIPFENLKAALDKKLFDNHFQF
jgi:hypothetical protein